MKNTFVIYKQGEPIAVVEAYNKTYALIGVLVRKENATIKDILSDEYMSQYEAKPIEDCELGSNKPIRYDFGGYTVEQDPAMILFN